MPMKPTSKASRCLAILTEGPSTTSEIALETGMTNQIACAHMCLLFKRGKVTRSPYHLPGMRPSWLWSLPAARPGDAHVFS